MKEVLVAQHAGTCFGVKNAIDIAFKAAKKEGTYISGDLVHNPQVVQELNEAGVRTISDVKSLKEGDSLIIRAHGEPKWVYEHCASNGINVVDASCPFVKRAQSLAEQLEQEGYQVVLIGDREHPEVKSILARTDNGIALLSKEDFCNLDSSKVGILSQTTQNKDKFIEMVSHLVCNVKEAKIHNTICSATTMRQNAATELAKQVDAMIVIGGKNSANTKQLFDLCSRFVPTYWVTHISDIEPGWLISARKIGITAGASTPQKVIDEFREHLSSFED